MPVPDGSTGEQTSSSGAWFTEIDEQSIRDHLDRDEFVWLDLTDIDRAQLVQLHDLFHLHPLAIEDTEAFGQRPKLDNYGQYAVLVFYAAWDRRPAGTEPLPEVHMVISGKYLITVHHGAVDQLSETQRELRRQEVICDQTLIYRVLMRLVDSFFPILSEIDDDVDILESSILANPTDVQLEELFELKRQLVMMRRVITPQRDLLAALVNEMALLPGRLADDRHQLHEIHDHLIRIGDLLDSCRELMSGATDLYLSRTSNRQNEAVKQLTVIATIFLPLGFITGFFGLDFSYLAGHLLDGRWLIGVATTIATVVALLVYFRRKGWIAG